MALTRKNLMVDADQLAALAARRGTSESAAVREAVEAALFAEEFGAAMEELRATGYGAEAHSRGVESAVVDPAEATSRTVPSP
jgi:hypothetical protein